MNTLSKIENTILKIESEGKPYETNVNLTYAELKDYRRWLLLSELNEKLSADNLRSGLKLKGLK